MEGEFALAMMADMLVTAALVSAPVLIVTLLVGLVISVLQVVTSIQESTLTFVPKLGAAAAVLLVFGPWMLATLAEFAVRTITGVVAR